MKKSIIVIAFLVPVLAKAQTGAAASGPPDAVPAPTAYSVVAQGANHRVWERTVYEPGPNGIVVGRKHHYTELATGMNYLNKGQWVQSQEQISVLPQGGAQAVQGQHQAHFPGDIYKGQIELVTPDGKKLKGRPLLLSFDDGTNTMLLGQLKHSSGLLVGSNQVVYPDAFDGVKADLVYTYRKGGFEQDVVLREQPPTPESLGLSTNAQLQVLTEFTGSPEPGQKAAARNRQDSMQDTTLTFGAMKMVQGRAFATGGSGGNSGQKNQSRSAAKGETPTFKTWMHVQNRTFLIEAVPYQRLAPQLKQLPMMSRVDTATTNLMAANSILGKVSPQRLLPPGLSKSEIGNQKSEMIQLARADVFQKPGVVLDYEAVDSEDSYTFQSGETYYVSGPVNISNLTIEGGAVIKYDYAASVNVLGGITCATSPYQQATLTSVDDDGVGEPVDIGNPPSTGTLNIGITLSGGSNGGYGLYNYYSPYDSYENDGGLGNNMFFSVSNVMAGSQCAIFIAPYWNNTYWDIYPSRSYYTLNCVNGFDNYTLVEFGAPLGSTSVGLSLANGGTLNNLNIRNLDIGVQMPGGASLTAKDLQIFLCDAAFDLEEGAYGYVGNVLMSQVGVGFESSSYYSVTAENVTFDQGMFFADSSGGSSITLNNSLLTDVFSLVDDWNGANVGISPNHTVSLLDGTVVYQTDYYYYYAGQFFYFYLPPDSPYRNIGTTAIDPGLLAELQTTTTYATQDGGWPDNDGMPDLGYHYPVDPNALFNGVPAWCLWQYFGTYAYNGVNLDATGNTLLSDYQKKTSFNYFDSYNNLFYFIYQGTDNTIISYKYAPAHDGVGGWGDGTLHPLTCSVNGMNTFLPSEYGGLSWITDGGEKFPWDIGYGYRLLNVTPSSDALNIRWGYPYDNPTSFVHQFVFQLTGRTLTIQATSISGTAGCLDLDRCDNADHPVVIPVPYLTLMNVLYTGGANGVFCSMYFDWEKTAASTISPYDSVYSDTSVYYAQKATYLPRTDGTRNNVSETIKLTVSPSLSDVLPDVPNPPSTNKTLLANYLVFDNYQQTNTDFADVNAAVQTVATNGVTNLWVIVHTWQNQGYDSGYPDVLPAYANLGGPAGLLQVSQTASNYGCLFALHENYVDFYTNAASSATPTNYWWNNYTNCALDTNGYPKLSYAWTNAYSTNTAYEMKPAEAAYYAGYFAPLIHSNYNTTASFLDVHSSINPSDKVDYDITNAPGAGTFLETLNQYRNLFGLLRASHNGPVSGEGYNHMLYLGYIDDVEAQIDNVATLYTTNATGQWLPLLVDFDLLKLHKLAVTHGVGFYERFYTAPDNSFQYLVFSNAAVLEYMATELAYGHGGYFPAPDRLYDYVATAKLEQRHVLPVQRLYANATPVSILYHDPNKNDEVSASDYIRRYPTTFASQGSTNYMSQVRVTYDNGVVVCVNRYPSDIWTVQLGQPGGWFNYNAVINNANVQWTGYTNVTSYTLPRTNGWVVYVPTPLLTSP